MPRSEVPWVRPAVPGDSARVRVPTGSIDVLGDWGPFLRSRRVDQLSRTNQARVRVLKVSTSCPGLLTIWSEGPRCHQLAWMTHSWV